MNYNKLKVCIIGLGKMGHRYSEYLDEYGVDWTYYDPFVAGGLNKLEDLDKYSHIMISTPPENHYDSYQKVIKLNPTSKIYLDKPVIIKDTDLNVLENKNVFCGMTERYNPTVIALKQLIDIKELISIKFSRYSMVLDNIETPVLFDLGIHDLDLYLYLLGFDKFPGTYDVFEKSKTCYIITKQHDILSIFEWSHESKRRERKILVFQKNTVYEADLIDQTILLYGSNQIIKNLHINKGQPLGKIIKSFLDNECCDAKLSHAFMMKIMQNKWDREPSI